MQHNDKLGAIHQRLLVEKKICANVDNLGRREGRSATNRTSTNRKNCVSGVRIGVRHPSTYYSPDCNIFCVSLVFTRRTQWSRGACPPNFACRCWTGVSKKSVFVRPSLMDDPLDEFVSINTVCKLDD